MNLARWRALPIDLGSDYVHVNIPEYRLRLAVNGNESLSMRVVVGSTRHPTPEFSDQIEYLVFNPYWNVPYSIWSREILPKLVEDTSYLAANNYELIGPDGVVSAQDVGIARLLDRTGDYRVRQRPGPDNALGEVKFIFPNEHNVYLHDSPSRHLYALSGRAFSHGCIRVESPDKLAAALLQQSADWQEQDVTAAMASSRRKRVSFAAPIPVYLTYITATVTQEGRLSLPLDVYGRDLAAMNAGEYSM